MFTVYSENNFDSAYNDIKNIIKNLFAKTIAILWTVQDR